MSKKLLTLLSVVLLLGLFGMNSQLMAQVVGNPVNVTINVDIQQFLWLRFEKATIYFSWHTPQNPSEWIDADDNPFEIWALAFVPKDQNVSLYARATCELVSGTDIITVNDHIRWTGSGDFAGGPWNLTTTAAPGQEVVSWEGFGFYEGTFIFQYYNDPRAPGTYTTTVVYTLVSP